MFEKIFGSRNTPPPRRSAEARPQQELQSLAEMDFYQRLGVSRHISEKDLKSAYLKKVWEAREKDRASGTFVAGGEATNETLINEAYQKLRDLETRRKYDRTLPPAIEKEPTQLERLRQFFFLNRTFDTAKGIPPSETFNKLKQEFVQAGKITEEEASELEAALLGKAA